MTEKISLGRCASQRCEHDLLHHPQVQSDESEASKLVAGEMESLQTGQRVRSADHGSGSGRRVACRSGRRGGGSQWIAQREVVERHRLTVGRVAQQTTERGEERGDEGRQLHRRDYSRGGCCSCWRRHRRRSLCVCCICACSSAVVSVCAVCESAACDGRRHTSGTSVTQSRQHGGGRGRRKWRRRGRDQVKRFDAVPMMRARRSGN